MPHASPTLRLLRVRAGVKPGSWAARVHMHRSAYSLVENGHRSASKELFGRCAALLTELLGEKVDPDDLMVAQGDDDEHEHTDAGSGPPTRGDSTGPGRLHPGMRAAS